MKEIPLTRGKFAVVDNENFDSLSQNKWHYWIDPKSLVEYAVRHKKIKGKVQRLMMHREITRSSHNLVIDHRNGNGLDNRRENLRTCTKVQNNMNRKPNKSNQTGLKGISWNTQIRKWKAGIGFKGKAINLGHYYDKRTAALVYRLFSVLYYGEFAFSERGKNESLRSSMSVEAGTSLS